jgi:hypothetical protein
LNSTRYNDADASQFDFHLFKITDAQGQDAGYQTFVTSMLDQIKASAKSKGIDLRLFFRQRVETIHTTSADVVLGTQSTRIYVSRRNGSVLLNLPQIPLLNLLASLPMRSKDESMLPEQLHLPNPAPYVKVYLHYKTAWWRKGRYGLDLVSGHFSNQQLTSRDIIPGVDTMHVFPGAESPAPLQGAYHDGHVRCGATEASCRGYIQAYYGGDQFAHMYYRGFGLIPAGRAVVNVTRSRFAGRALLNEVHAALVRLHERQLGAAAAREILANKITQPDHAVLAVWDAAADGFGAACHFSQMICRQTMRLLRERA